MNKLSKKQTKKELVNTLAHAHSSLSVCVYVCIPHQRALHDALEVDEVQVIGCGGAIGAVAHCVQHLGRCNTKINK